jgi:c-di-GMP-related signal transduction protein
MLTAVSQAELDVREIENLVKGEASLCYRLLRYLNSAAFAFANENSLGPACTGDFRRWFRLVATLGAGQGKTTELVLSAMVRARFCELVSPKTPHGDSDLFLMGMLSTMDVILEIPMSQVLDNVPIDQESKAVLLGGASRLRPFYQLMLAQSPGSGRPPMNWPRNFISPKAKSRSVTGKPCNGHAR